MRKISKIMSSQNKQKARHAFVNFCNKNASFVFSKSLSLNFSTYLISLISCVVFGEIPGDQREDLRQVTKGFGRFIKKDKYKMNRKDKY